MQTVSDIKQQIFKELSSLEETVAKLRSVAANAGKQTDLEVAILTEQVKTLREKNSAASDLIGKSISILNALKAGGA
ncbi:MAG: hypothetical protein LBJ73_05330 [Rickettsiales bacterium]|jgi:hypothetical protein|nr:hypothetical protein [Rickettsiales bacterium]